jgi:integrase
MPPQRAALNAVIRAGHITANPASLAELPPARRPRAVVRTGSRIEEWRRSGIRPAVAVWTPAQTAAFLNSIRSHRLYAGYHLIALRGLRRGEACGLRWCDIDLDAATAVIAWLARTPSAPARTMAHRPAGSVTGILVPRARWRLRRPPGHPGGLR